MDVNLIATSALDLPSSQRVDAIVHDGTIDMKLWPGPGPDRELLEHYGPELQSVLDRERTEHGVLPVGGMVRVHRGKLHADFLLWIGTRPPEKAGIQAPAPTREILHRAVKDALAFVAERHVRRVAFRIIGAGPSALDETDRIVLIAQAANEYYDECFKAGKPAGVEHVLVCHPHSSKISAARRVLGRAVKVQEVPMRGGADESPAPKKRASTSGGKKASTGRKPAKQLAEDDVAKARATAGPYDRTHKYAIGEFFIHAKFGVGRVEELTSEGFIVVLFEGGDTKRLLHASP